MGEFSKRIGEYGEEIVSEFLDIVGWELQSNFDISCKYQEAHLPSKERIEREILKSKKPEEKARLRRTHGIDFAYFYENPLISNTLDNVLISSKFSDKDYPKTPDGKSSKFKDYIEDLTFALECFMKEQLRGEFIGNRSFNKVHDVGVLFWLNNANDNSDVIKELYTSRISSEYNFEAIYLVDNRRMGFIYDSIQYVKFGFQKDDEKIKPDWYFVYYLTGKNSGQLSSKEGKILPVQLLTTSILPFKIVKENEMILCLTAIDNFSSETFAKILGLARDISINFQGKTYIAFPDYNKPKHENIVEKVKRRYNNSLFTKNVFVENFYLQKTNK